GRGPIPESMGRFDALRLVRGGAVLEYTAGGAKIREWTTVSEQNGQPVIERHVSVGAAARPMRLVLGRQTPGTAISLGLTPGQRGAELVEAQGVWSVRIAPHAQPVALVVALSTGGTPVSVTPRPMPSSPAASRWSQEVTTTVSRSTAPDA